MSLHIFFRRIVWCFSLKFSHVDLHEKRYQQVVMRAMLLYRPVVPSVLLNFMPSHNHHNDSHLSHPSSSTSFEIIISCFEGDDVMYGWMLCFSVGWTLSISCCSLSSVIMKSVRKVRIFNHYTILKSLLLLHPSCRKRVLKKVGEPETGWVRIP